ncbi:LolA family protein [Mucilaginibacter segetis]|uniref:Outer membrane lipoprotein carrier protein LolA n=1 Tax=Mucilaginibacter segetis TaxID=2793071 RepID=A0A934PSD8_9SPHI|nr:outer membrane lipoprotein carrier protein LolA [Mucilaginibacter segetis]MBK0378627.1 outer membrane lipoprotein carrier protein LolA [Mucilaginibacter segetis]
MKKILLYILISATTVASAFAQKDAQAKTILNKLSRQYKAYSSVKTDFLLKIDNQQAGISQTQSGTLIVRPKTNKYRVVLYAGGTASKTAVAQEIISDGKSQWTYLKDAGEVQLSDADNSAEAFNPSQIFTMYEHGFKYLYTGQQKAGGKIYQVIDLTPEDANRSYFKVRLMVDKAHNRLYSAQIFDKNGGRYNYILRSFTPNVKITDATFTYNKSAHPGVEVVDLR